MKPRFLMSLLALSTAAPAYAYDWSVEAKVDTIEVSYMPSIVPFSISKVAGNCVAGAWLYWNIKGADAASQAQNAQTVMSALIAAKSTGQTIRIFGSNTGCKVDYMHIIP